VATSNPVGRYLGSTKNIVGSACGLLGLILHLFGLAGSYWLLVVAGLYAAGALAAPPDKVALAVEDASTEAGRLRRDLDELVARVREHRHRVPAEALVVLDSIASRLRDLLARTDALTAAPDRLYEIGHAVRTDLPASFETYLNLPGWFATGRGPGTRRTAADELVAQLDLIAAALTATAERMYEGDAQRLRGHTNYLEERGRSSALD
jgi:hypothetical protein